MQDSIGNPYSIGEGKSVKSVLKLRPGDEVQFKLVASDPMGEAVEYLVYPNSRETVAAARNDGVQWNETGSFSFDILPEYVGERFIFVAAVRSTREFHAQNEHVIGKIDDKVVFNYEFLPPR